MSNNEVWRAAECYGPEGEALIAGLAGRGWKLNELESAELKVFWLEALGYARWEIRQYAVWREQDEPVLAGGYDAEAVVQAAFARLLEREAGGVPISYTVEEIRRKLRGLVKHRVRWLHEREETGLIVSEWDVLPVRANGELVSIFEYLPGKTARPDQEVMEKERVGILADFKVSFERTLVGGELADVLGGMWTGEKRREIARRLGSGVERVNSLQRQVNRRLAKFAMGACGGTAEVLGTFCGSSSDR
jgi:hypothetical protein